jgi:hypothetical protein
VGKAAILYPQLLANMMVPGREKCLTFFSVAFRAEAKYIHTMKKKSIYIVRFVLLFLAVLGSAQNLSAQEDGKRIIFTDPKSKDKPVGESELLPKNNSWGFNLMIGMDGFGLGGFYGYTFADELTLFTNLSFSEARDARQIDYYDPWYGVYNPNKENYVYRIPLLVGLQYRLFKEEIVDNFRPFVNAGMGPVLMYITRADMDFFSGLFHGRSKYTFGGFIGVGSQFGFDRSYVLGVNIKYFIIPLPPGVQSVQQGTLNNANGFFITLDFGSTF